MEDDECAAPATACQSDRMPMTLGPLVAEHWPAVARIFVDGIATAHATFETTVPTWR